MTQNQGTPNRLNDEQRRLVEDNLGLVGFVLRKYGTQGLDSSDDTYQIGVMGLLNAAAGYQSERSKFSTYAVRCIINELRTERRKMQRACRGREGNGQYLDMSFDPQAPTECALFEALLDESVDLDGPINYAHAQAFIRKTLEQLQPRHARMIEDYLFGDMNQKEIAARYRCSTSQVSNVLTRGLRLLRQHMRGAGYEC